MFIVSCRSRTVTLASALVAIATLSLAAPSSGASVAATPTCFGQPATIIGTSGPDNLPGTSGPDVIVGKDGDDTINGKGGKDRICAGNGNDTVTGGGGSDKVQGGDGDDTMTGESGRDRLVGEGGSDRADGGEGVDGCFAEETLACEADLAIAIEVRPAFVGAYAVAHYGVTVTNNGPSPVGDLQLTFDLDTGIDYADTPYSAWHPDCQDEPVGKEPHCWTPPWCMQDGTDPSIMRCDLGQAGVLMPGQTGVPDGAGFVELDVVANCSSASAVRTAHGDVRSPSIADPDDTNNSVTNDDLNFDVFSCN